LFSGLIGVPSGLNKTVGLIMPAAWSFDAIKRFSALDTLEVEGAKPNSAIGGKGYYKYIETENDRIIRESREKIEVYKKSAENKKQLRKPIQKSFDPKSKQGNTLTNLVKLHTWLRPSLQNLYSSVRFRSPPPSIVQA